MTVEEAIKQLRQRQSMMGTPASAEAFRMALSALEKEKEPAPQEAETSSQKNNSIDNDNTKLKICQEIIEVAARILTSYVGYLPEREQKLWEMGGAHALLKRADKLFEGENK